MKRVYVCSSLKPRNVARVDRLLVKLQEQHPEVSFFRPYGTDPATMMDTVREDVREIEGCDELWLIGKYGRDSSWELGAAFGLGKKIKIFRDYSNAKRLEQDEMYKIALEKGLAEIVELKEGEKT